MNRRSWSNFFVVLATASLVLAFWPAHPFRIVGWIAAAICLTVSAVARRRMI
jgi:hypothetical protein